MGSFRWQSKYPWCIIEVKIKKFPIVFNKSEKKVTENENFYAKPVFNKIEFYIATEKLITVST